MHQRRSKKIIIYFLLFFSIGTVNNIELNNKNFLKIEKINIFGFNDIEVLNVENDLNNLASTPYTRGARCVYKETLINYGILEQYDHKKDQEHIFKNFNMPGYAIIFTSYMLHKVEPITSGKRKTI